MQMVWRVINQSSRNSMKGWFASLQNENKPASQTEFDQTSTKTVVTTMSQQKHFNSLHQYLLSSSVAMANLHYESYT